MTLNKNKLILCPGTLSAGGPRSPARRSGCGSLGAARCRTPAAGDGRLLVTWRNERCLALASLFADADGRLQRTTVYEKELMVSRVFIKFKFQKPSVFFK